ncbi:MAG: hypothetical protein ABSE40_09370 [Candidatus Sulfotelmatobacter sp.]|jgi:integrase-like protein
MLGGISALRNDGRRARSWYGTYRLDTPEGRRPINILLGTLQELPTKVSARDKLREKIAEMTKREAIPSFASSMKFSELVERWKQNEGPGIGETTLEHYSNALRASVLPKWKNHRIDSLQREDITKLLNSQAAKYSRSSLKSMRVVILRDKKRRSG